MVLAQTDDTCSDAPQKPGPDSLDVSIIIVSWNTRDVLRDCLGSILHQTRARHEIIVIDNASQDGTAEMVVTSFPGVRLIANRSNRGFAAANNQGLNAARGRSVLLLNPDTVILDHAVDRMLAWLDDHPDVGCAGCQVLESEGRVQKTCFADPGPWSVFLVEFAVRHLAPRSAAAAHPDYADWDRRTARDVDVVSGMFMLVPTRVVRQVGPLDEAFFVYSEEADWCRRIRAAGWRCVFTPETRILHRDGGGKSTAQIRPRMHVQMQKSKLIYLRKHHGLWGALAGWAIFVLSSALRAISPVGLERRDAAAGRRLARAALRYHLLGTTPAG